MVGLQVQGRASAAPGGRSVFLRANPSIRLHRSACTGARMSDSPLAWDDFRLVKSIAEARGLAGAAEKLGVNHSTGFRRLGPIEERVWVKLFRAPPPRKPPTPPRGGGGGRPGAHRHPGG